MDEIQWAFLFVYFLIYKGNSILLFLFLLF